jgi:hypothetical protein
MSRRHGKNRRLLGIGMAAHGVDTRSRSVEGSYDDGIWPSRLRVATLEWVGCDGGRRRSRFGVLGGGWSRESGGHTKLLLIDSIDE